MRSLFILAVFYKREMCLRRDLTHHSNHVHRSETRRDSPVEIWRATSGRLKYTYGTASFKIWESTGRARDTRS